MLSLHLCEYIWKNMHWFLENGYFELVLLFSQNKKLQTSKCLAYFWAGAEFIADDVRQ